MNTTCNKGSLLDDFDVLDRRINKNTILDWIKANFIDYEGLSISDNPNKDGLYEVNAKYLRLNSNSKSLTNGMFVWKNVAGDFSCYCGSLTSLKGAPKKVGRNFYCHYCDSLKTLEGAPEKVGGNFYCHYCESLISLKGAPEEVRWNFYCRYCSSLTSHELPPTTKIKGKIIR